MAEEWPNEANESADDPGGGFQRAGRRELSPDERRVVRGRARRLWAKFAVAVLAFWVGLIAALVTEVIREEAQGIARIGLILLMLLLFLGTIALFLAARSCLRESGALARDARRGFVQRYAGVFPPEGEQDLALRLLLEAGLLQPESPEPQWFEILPRSGLLWQVNGARPPHWIPVMEPEVIEVAETPAFAAVAAEWAEPVVRQGETREALRVGERELSADELRELKQHLRREVRSLLAWAIPCNLWFGTMLVLLLPTGHLLYAFQEIRLLFLGAVTVVGDLALIPRFRQIARSARDARIGRVVIVRQPVFDDDDPEETAAASATLELLPISEDVWTLDGRPAWWRTAG